MSVKPHPTLEHTWIIRWRPEGRSGSHSQITVYDCDEGRAKAIELNLRQKPGGTIHNATNPQLRHVLPEWLAWMRLHRSAKTVESIGWALKHLEPHFGPLTVPQITEAVVYQYQKKRKSTPRSCNLELDYLKSCVSWMVKRHLCKPLPFSIERLPYQRPLPRIPSPEDLMAWLDAMEPDGPWDKITKTRHPGPKNALIWIMVRCGLRFVEATHLLWENIDWSQNIIHVDKTKGGRPRIAVLPKEARQILHPLRQKKDGTNKTGWIAPSAKTGEPYGNMKSLFKTASQRSGVHIKGPHALRHICGTYILNATGDLRLVQQTLGHTQVRTTELYTQVSIDRLRHGQDAAGAHMVRHENRKATQE